MKQKDKEEEGLKGVPLVTIAMLYGMSLEDNLKKFKKLFGELDNDSTEGWKPVLTVIEETIKDHFFYSDNLIFEGVLHTLTKAIQNAISAAHEVKLLLSKKENTDFNDDENETTFKIVMNFFKLTKDLIEELSLYDFEEEE